MLPRLPMLKTPLEHLPRFYPGDLSWAPEWSAAEKTRYAPIWDRAFEIHESAHPYDGSLPAYCLWVINPINAPEKGGTPYCDCYERAYREMEKAGELVKLGIEPRAAEAPPES